MIGKLLLNRYELLEKIGEGGMGIVYKAKCHLLSRIVAVKILKSELNNDEEFVARFKREATSAARLSHPNIVNVHDVGTDNDINFIVMEYINGKTLKQIIKSSGRLSSKETINIASQIARALDCAHKNNIIHRDIKPDNILITEDNIVKVADFGIAKITDSRTITNSSKVMGTAHYFSPEQAQGNFVDVRTDVYSLGIVMYEMVTGRVPYNAESSISVAMMHIQETATPPSDVTPDIPQNVNGVILKAMEKEPINRYQTAKEMEEILNQIEKNPNFKLYSNNSSDDATKYMEPVVVADSVNDYTMVMSQGEISKNPIIKKDKKVLAGNKGPSKNKKTIIIIASILLFMFIGVLANNISTGRTGETQAVTKSEEIPIKEVAEKVIEKLPIVEKKFVPSVIGDTQDNAKQTIVDNGFTLGNISNNYSDSVDKGLVISQTPEINTSYEKGGKIDLVISQGKKIVQVTVPELKGETLDKAKDILEELKLDIGEETLVKTKGKGSKDKHSKDEDDSKIILTQDKAADSLVEIGTKINVSYSETKNK
jgi:serine/threonine protein kinase